MAADPIAIAPLTEDRWGDAEALFGQGGDPKTWAGSASGRGRTSSGSSGRASGRD